MAAPVPIYVIALEHTLARRKAISERLGALGLSFTFINAVNGKNLAEDEIDNFCFHIKLVLIRAVTDQNFKKH